MSDLIKAQDHFSSHRRTYRLIFYEKDENYDLDAYCPQDKENHFLVLFHLLWIFLLYSTLTGISLSTIFSIYTSSSIASTFFISSLTFGVMALTGYTTKTYLTKWGSLLFMGVICIVIASIINMFLGSSLMHYLISIVGVLVFTGLTAYDVQKIKNIGNQIDEWTQTAQKLMIMGALTLYLDFINLFLMMLRLFGNRN